jgi:predicted nuclease of restriction endonuclease-like RecB superfamily
MLRREHAAFDVRAGRVVPDKITRTKHSDYPGYAEKLLELFRNGIGKTHRELERETERILDADPECPLRRSKAFFKLLEEVSEFDTDKGHKAWLLRKQVMDMAVPFQPLKRLGGGLWGTDESEVKAHIAEKLGRPWVDIEASLFTDIKHLHKLLSFKGYSGGAELLNRYNVAQCQGVLFNCTKLKVEARDDFKRILRYAKLARLLHQITRLGDGHYCFEFTGPASVLRDTPRYGTKMAEFLPSLLRCKGWMMEADIKVGRRWAKFHLSPENQLRPSWEEKNDGYDSSLEAAFVGKWGPDPREGWSLVREGDILWKEQHVFTPDFVLSHKDGRRVFLEIAGFWSPEYVAQKRATLAMFKNEMIILAVPHDLLTEYGDLPRTLVSYKTGLLSQPVLDALERLPQTS